MSEPHATHKDLTEAMEDLRADTGVAVARAREDWLQELDLRLETFAAKLSLRVYLSIAVAVGILKFDPSPEVTGAGAAVLVAVKGLFVLGARLN